MTQKYFCDEKTVIFPIDVSTCAELSSLSFVLTANFSCFMAASDSTVSVISDGVSSSGNDCVVSGKSSRLVFLTAGLEGGCSFESHSNIIVSW